ncbi:MAG: DUF2752 domain-containing protein [Bryobacterales bacterium]|nr:DUF2752 domain-containing protein [Bryobacterales bacterium]
MLRCLESLVSNPRRIAWLLAVLVAAGVGLLYATPPEQAWFMPACPVHRMTGLLCPGCGTARALHALLHGHIHEALLWNPLLLVLLPGLAIVSVLLFADAIRDNRVRDLRLAPWASFSLVAVVVAFTILRNLPNLWSLTGWGAFPVR